VIRPALFLLCTLLFAADGYAQTTRELKLNPLPSPSEELEKGSLSERAHASALIKRTIATVYDLPSDSYCLIHVVRWTDPVVDQKSVVKLAGLNAELADAQASLAGATSDALRATLMGTIGGLGAEIAAVTKLTKPRQTPESSRWYIHHPSSKWSAAEYTGTRIYGTDQLFLLSIHTNLDGELDVAKLKVKYVIEDKVKTPEHLKNLMAIAALFNIPEIKSLSVEERDTTVPQAAWGAEVVSVNKTSDITITGTLASVAWAKEGSLSLGKDQKFDNEGKTIWDASIAVPIRGAKDLSPDKDAGLLNPKEVKKENVFAAIHIFFQPVDAKAKGLKRAPSLMFGMAIREKPINQMLLALSWSPFGANFYGGMTLVRRQNADGTPVTGKKYEVQPALGVSVSVKWFQDTIKAAKK
jgi:hypothetical protein